MSWLASGAVGLSVAIGLLLSRLPPTADFILPRRPFFPLFGAAIKVQQSPGLAAAVSAFCLLLLGLALALFSREAYVQLKSGGKGLRLSRIIAVAAMLLASAAASWLFLRAALDLIQNVLFAPESLDIREPAAAFAAAFLAALALWRTVRAAIRGTRREAAILLAASLIFAVGLSTAAVRLRSDLAVIRDPPSRRVAVLLVEGPGGSDYEVHDFDLAVNPGSLQALERRIRQDAGGAVDEAVRALWAGYTVLMDASALREALYLAQQRGDSLARMLLLQNLAGAPRQERTQALLEALADETSFRIGPQAAAMIAVAYGRFGSAMKAQDWLSRSGSGAIPAGLLPPPGPPLNGIIRGRALGLGRPQVALYSRRDSEAPYGVGASSLVDSVRAGAGGEFEFKGLSAGSYFLAFLFDPTAPPLGFSALGKCALGSGAKPPCLSFISNHRGDTHLSAQRPRADLGALEPHFLAP